MTNVNRVILTGKCKDYPDVIETSEKPTAELILETNGGDISIFFKGAEIVKNCKEYLKKGMEIMVEGKIINNNKKMCIEADNVCFLEHKDKKE